MGNLYILANDFQYVDPSQGVTTLKAGKTIDDSLYNVASMQTGGAILYASNPAALAVAARLVSLDVNKGQQLSITESRRFDAIGSFVSGVTQLASVTHANSPFTVIEAQQLIEVDVTGGVCTVLFEASPAIGAKHDVKNIAGDPGTNPITVNGNGHNVEDPASLQTFSSTVNLVTRGASYSYKFDGTNWVLS
jgi:hypothetical protein